MVGQIAFVASLSGLLFSPTRRFELHTRDRNVLLRTGTGTGRPHWTPPPAIPVGRLGTRSERTLGT